ncbi:MAG: endopeptidase La [bacterium]|jgi:ATP-dependent Lon protease|nr:endopeptidase La [bacterium]
MTKSRKIKSELPQGTLRILPLEGVVPLPNIIFPVMIREEEQQQLILDTLKDNKILGVFTRIIPENLESEEEKLYDTGVACSILKIIQVGDGNVRILLRGLYRIRISDEIQSDMPYRIAQVSELREKAAPKLKSEAYIRSVSELFQRIISISPIFPDEMQDVLFGVEDPGKLSDLIASALSIPVSEKYRFLTELNVQKRLELLLISLRKELKIIELNTRINDHINDEVNRQQREFILREQIEAIKKELGESEDEDPEIRDLYKLAKKIALTEEARTAVTKEIERLSMMSPYSSEYTVSKSYIDWMLELPWGRYTDDNLDVERASAILEEDHYGLQDIKERILEFLSVLKLHSDVKSPILCLVGPPGVGKTSLGKSIARAMNRQFIRFSVGGMRDEAEIRGHRKTYIGSMPGRIIQYVKKCGSQNPVIMLDEVDKIGSDFRGDPSSALLEVLDPEQNKDFRDNYLEVAFDLSRVFFIATANSTHNIPPALLDRMELISLPGYITPEKAQIARQFLIPRQLEQNGIKPGQLRFSPGSIELIIEHYTMEAGVRALEREIARVCRKSARLFAKDPAQPRVFFSKKNIEEFLGPKKIFKDNLPDRDEVGIVVGLAYTDSGGDVLPVEVTLMPGKGNYHSTGQLGDVMKESVETAISYLRSSAEKYRIEAVSFFNQDIHIHFPAAAIPKDGPSAGVTVTAALLSCLSGRKVRHDVAMTGEISLRGRVLPIGGVREKVTAAKRMGIKTVILPKANQSDLEKVPDMVRTGMQFCFVEHFREIADRVLL